MTVKERALTIAQEIMREKFPQAMAGFCAGSIIRGEGTATSDLDLVVVYPHLENCWRESFLHQELPVEAFVHDPETLKYFFQEVDRKSGIPSLPQMVVEGIQVWGDLSHGENFKNIAQATIALGPPQLTEDGLRNQIYGITDLLDDLQSPRSREEAVGAAIRLYETLGDFALRSRGNWSGNGKQISRALKRANPNLALEFTESFETFFSQNDSKKVIALCEKILAPHGGRYFSGFKRFAPKAWRMGTGANQISTPELKTARLLLRFANQNDIPAIITFYRENEVHLENSGPKKPEAFYTQEYWQNRIQNDHGSFLADRAVRFYAFELANLEKPIATIEFSQISRGPFQACYLGYGIAKNQEGKGIMQEALRASLDYIFQQKNIHRVMANHLPENHRSARILERLGFVKEGIAKDYLLIDDAWRSHVLTSLTNPNWKGA